MYLSSTLDPKTNYRSKTYQRICQAKVRIPRLIKDILRNNRQEETELRRCHSLEEVLFHELRNYYRGRGPWTTQVPGAKIIVTLTDRNNSLAALHGYQRLTREEAYGHLQVVLAYGRQAAA